LQGASVKHWGCGSEAGHCQAARRSAGSRSSPLAGHLPVGMPGRKLLLPGGPPRKHTTRPADAQPPADGFWVVLGLAQAVRRRDRLLRRPGVQQQRGGSVGDADAEMDHPRVGQGAPPRRDHQLDRPRERPRQHPGHPRLGGVAGRHHRRDQGAVWGGALRWGSTLGCDGQ
jgi:hypothetical protein